MLVGPICGLLNHSLKVSSECLDESFLCRRIGCFDCELPEPRSILVSARWLYYHYCASLSGHLPADPLAFGARFVWVVQSVHANVNHDLNVVFVGHI